MQLITTYRKRLRIFGRHHIRKLYWFRAALASLVQIRLPFYRSPVIDSSPPAESVRSIVAPVYVYPDAGGAIVTHENRFLAAYSVFPWGNEYHPIRTRFLFLRKRRFVERAIYLLTPEAEGNFYHWIFDCLPRLQLMRSHMGADLSDVAIVLHQKVAPYEKESLRLGNCDTSQRLRLGKAEVLACSNMLVPKIFPDSPESRAEKVQLLNAFFQNVGLPSGGNACEGQAYYISRSAARKRRVRNESELIAKLESIGIEALQLESHTLEDQIRYFRQAHTVIAPHGAGLVLSAFMPKGATLIEIMNRHCPKHFFKHIAEARGLCYHAIYVEPDGEGLTKELLSDPIHGNALDLLLEHKDLEQVIALAK